jgi:D-tyrosyl-tRNA(Tyr) deacylase
MICVIQRVNQASVAVDGQIVSQIGPGMLVLAAVHATDAPDDVDWTARKLAGLRIFAAGDRNFDRDVKEIGGSILLVSNFTVAGDARKGRRPSLSDAADPTLRPCARGGCPDRPIWRGHAGCACKRWSGHVCPGQPR